VHTEESGSDTSEASDEKWREVRNKGWDQMKKFCELCMRAKVVLVELASLLAFCWIVICGLYLEYQSILHMVRK